MKSKFAVIAVLLLSMCGSLAVAGEIDLLTNTLAEKGIITYGEAQQIMTETKESTRKDLAAGKIEIIPAWIQNLSMKGDLRLRVQDDWAASSSVIRNRERLRLRLGFETRPVENLKAGFGLATGSEKISDKTVTGTAPAGLAAGAITGGTVAGDTIIDAEPTSTNHTFGNGFSKPMVMVDYAFLEYTPFSWMKVTGGKMKSGTNIWHATDLLWDTDINPDGVAVALNKDLGGRVNLFLTGSWLVINELNSAKNNPDYYSAQPGIAWKPTDMIDVKAAVGYEVFNVNGKNTGYYGTPAFDYVCLTPSVNVGFKELVSAYSLNVFGDSVSNSDSKPTSDKAGKSYGLTFGHPKVSGFGTWQATYMQRRLEANAWMSKLGDSDAFGGALNSTGYEAILTFGLTQSASLGVDYYSMDQINNATAATPKSLVQFDLVYKF